MAKRVYAPPLLKLMSGSNLAVPATVHDVFAAVVNRQHPRVMLNRSGESWVALSSQDFCRRVLATSQALHDWGIAPGDRVAILSENRPEWAIADFAVLLLKAVSVPIYPTLTDEQTAYLLRDSGSRVIFLSSEAHLRKVSAIQNQTGLEKIVVMDDVPGAFAMAALFRGGLAHLDGGAGPPVGSIRPDDLATLIYTSGTTGVPKGVMLTHGNLASNLACSLEGFDVSEEDTSLSFLPLSHITARHVDLAVLYRGGTVAYVPFVDQIAQALLEVRPTFFVGVPRVYEKVFSQTEQKTKKFPASWIYRWALNVGRSHEEETLAGKTPPTIAWKVADRLLFSKIRAGMGGRVRVFISGGAPLGRELARWYAHVGIRLHEGYGLTETSPVIAVNTPKAHRLGTVGRPLSNIEVRIADDGEILVRGPSVFKSYWNNPEETRKVFEDGWFKTGDIGAIDADGFLSVTDRKKDLIKTSGGKFLAPQPIENSLKHNAMIAEAVVLGEKRKFPAVLISPYFPLLEDWARANQVPFASRQELVSHPKVQALYDGIIDDANRDLARFEKLKRVLLVAEEFSAEQGTLTASMKLRRRAVEEHYRQQIDAMYRAAEEAAR